MPIKAMISTPKSNDAAIWARSTCIAQYPCIRTEYPLRGAKVILAIGATIPDQVILGPEVRTLIVLANSHLTDGDDSVRQVAEVIRAAQQRAISAPVIIVPQIFAAHLRDDDGWQLRYMDICSALDMDPIQSTPGTSL
jgi:hypothetical protein